MRERAPPDDNIHLCERDKFDCDVVVVLRSVFREHTLLDSFTDSIY